MLRQETTTMLAVPIALPHIGSYTPAPDPSRGIRS